MSKKIQVNFRDEFVPGEFTRLAALVVQALRVEFPGFGISTYSMKHYQEKFNVYVYGVWDLDEGEAKVLAVRQTVGRLLSNIGWRDSAQPAQSSVGDAEGSIP
jgi:hypothetical protein